MISGFGGGLGRFRPEVHTASAEVFSSVLSEAHRLMRVDYPCLLVGTAMMLAGIAERAE